MKKINPILTVLTAVLFGVPVPALAQMGPNFNGSQAQFTPHAVHMNAAPQAHFQPQRQESPRFEAPVRPVAPLRVTARVPVQPRAQAPANHGQNFHQTQADHHPQRRDDVRRRHDDAYISYVPIAVPVPVDAGDLETIIVDGQTYFYQDGIFYQQQDGQLVQIPPVLGAVVQDIPENYVIVPADGTNYFFVDGVYYERLAQGFEVVAGPDTDQG